MKIKVEIIDIDKSLYAATKNSYNIIETFMVISIDPVEDVEGPIDPKDEDIQKDFVPTCCFPYTFQLVCYVRLSHTFQFCILCIFLIVQQLYWNILPEAVICSRCIIIKVLNVNIVTGLVTHPLERKLFNHKELRDNCYCLQVDGKCPQYFHDGHLVVEYNSKDEGGDEESRDPEGILDPVISVAVADTNKVDGDAGEDDEDNLHSNVVIGDKVS